MKAESDLGKKEEASQQISFSVELGICTKDRDGRVLSQNTLCMKACGNQHGEICADSCMQSYPTRKIDPIQSKFREGIDSKNSLQLKDGKFYDAAIFNDATHITTFLYPLESKIATLKEHCKNTGSSPRESQVAELAMQGMTNTEIAKHLFISKATVRTHLNNLYKRGLNKIR